MISNPYQKYQQSSVQTATPGQLVIMLYDGAIRFLKQGIVGIEERDINKANTNLQKVQRIVNELVASLDHQYPISGHLLEVYDYILRQLTEANVKKKKEPAEEVLTHLTELREAWAQASKSAHAAGPS